MVSAVTSIHPPFSRVRRWLFLGMVVVTTMVGVGMMLDIVRSNSVTGLERVILVLFALTFGWISIAFWNAVIGFVLNVLRRDPLSLRRVAAIPRGTGPVRSRTALVMPVHNEDPIRVTSSLEAMLRSLVRTGHGDRFDAFLLSDTTDPGVARLEEASFATLRRRVHRPSAVHYRRRAANIGRKAGNVEEFCRTRGGDYDFMVVLDADSVMTGSTVVELVRAMEATPSAGLIQTVPIPACRSTLFGRLLQFAACLYSPMLAAGQSFWQTDAANYWGHNAIIRLTAFTEHCRLPVLPGHPPLGGAILSHDFVVAALLRRAGWGVYLLPNIGGSYEEVPGNIVDYAKRDRRWSQGSLQHLRLLPFRGLHWMNRLHFLLGAMGYVSSLLWLLMLLASTAYIVLPIVVGRFPSSHVPLGRGVDQGWIWMNPGLLIPLLELTVVLLFVPKLLSLGVALMRDRWSFGGTARLLVSAALEMLFAVVVAPLMMMYHTRFVLSVLRGHDIQWAPQVRARRVVAWPEAWRQTITATVVGAVWAGLTVSYSPTFFLWLTPIFTGLLLAAPLVRLTSSRSLGQVARRWGLFLVPSEISPPVELQALEEPAYAPPRRNTVPLTAIPPPRRGTGRSLSAPPSS